MFIKTANGYLINLDNIEIIYIEAPNQDYCYYRVMAKKINGTISTALYKDKELQYCQEYMNDLEKKIAITLP